MVVATVIGNLVASPQEVGKDLDTTVARLRVAYDQPNGGTGFITVLAYGNTAVSSEMAGEGQGRLRRRSSSFQRGQPGREARSRREHRQVPGPG